MDNDQKAWKWREVAEVSYEASLSYLERVAGALGYPVDYFCDRLFRGRHRICSQEFIPWLQSMTDNEIHALIERPNTEKESENIVWGMISHFHMPWGNFLSDAWEWGKRRHLGSWGEIAAALEFPAAYRDFRETIECAAAVKRLCEPRTKPAFIHSDVDEHKRLVLLRRRLLGVI